MKKIFFLLLFAVIGFNTYSQNAINNYKYVLVPKKFDFVKTENKYQLNDLTKFLFEREGFVVVYGDEVPDDYAKNNCLALKADVKSKAKVFTVRLIVELRDCKNNLIFVSDIGKSKEKDFKRGYQQGLRNAFKSIEALNYKYDPSFNVATNNPIAASTITKTTVNTPEQVVAIPKKETIVKEKIPVVREVIVKQPVVKTAKNITNINNGVLYAQPIENGYQLVDSSPKIVYVLRATSIKDVFLLKNRKGVFFKKETNWVLEYYNNNGKLVQEIVNAKF